MFAAALGAIVAAGRQEAFQILLGTAGIFFASNYFAMFTIPLIARDSPWWLRVAAVSGLIVTVAFIVLTFIPIVEVQSKGRYAAIIAFAVIAANAAGTLLYRTARPRK